MADGIEGLEAQREAAEEELRKQRNTAEDIKINFGKDIKSMFNGFSENFYGNNWFVLSTNEGGKASAICGVLNEVPKMKFNTKLEAGPITALMDKMKEYTGRGGVAGAIGSATGTNVNIQLAGNYSVRYPIMTGFQEEGIKLEFTVWKNPDKIFDPVCCPSGIKPVISYLKNYATVVTSSSTTQLIENLTKSAEVGLGAIGPIVDSAVDHAKQTIMDGAKDLMKQNIPGAKLLMDDDKKEEAKTIGEQLSDNWDAIKNFGNGIVDFADQLLVRRWSDKQRITYGKEKFNQSLHRLDILRAGVLDTYLIVAIKDWSWQLDQNALGEKMKVTINCVIDQRMNQNRLRLYSERPMFG